MGDEMMRSLTAFAFAQARNNGLEEAAQMVESLVRDVDGSVLALLPNRLWALAQQIRSRKTSAASKLADAKIACGKIAGLLPAPSEPRAPGQ